MLTTGRNTLFFHSLCQPFFLLDPVLQISVWRSAQFGFPGRVSDSAAHIGCLSYPFVIVTLKAGASPRPTNRLNTKPQFCILHSAFYIFPAAAIATDGRICYHKRKYNGKGW